MKNKHEIRTRYAGSNTLVIDNQNIIPDIATVTRVGDNPTAAEHEAWINTAVAIRLLPKLQGLLELVGTVTKGTSGGRLGRLASAYASLLEAEHEEQRVARRRLGDGPQAVQLVPTWAAVATCGPPGVDAAHLTTCGCGCAATPTHDFPLMPASLPASLPALPLDHTYVGSGPLGLAGFGNRVAGLIGTFEGCLSWANECDGSSPRYVYAVRTNSTTHIRLLELRGWSPPLPSGLPDVPAGYRYAGAGPLPLSGRERVQIGDDDVLLFTYDGSPNEWVGHHLRGNGSVGNECHYVIQIGGPWDLLLRSRLTSAAVGGAINS